MIENLYPNSRLNSAVWQTQRGPQTFLLCFAARRGYFIWSIFFVWQPFKCSRRKIEKDAVRCSSTTSASLFEWICPSVCWHELGSTTNHRSPQCTDLYPKLQRAFVCPNVCEQTVFKPANSKRKLSEPTNAFGGTTYNTHGSAKKYKSNRAPQACTYLSPFLGAADLLDYFGPQLASGWIGARGNFSELRRAGIHFFSKRIKIFTVYPY